MQVTIDINLNIFEIVMSNTIVASIVSIGFDGVAQNSSTHDGVMCRGTTDAPID